MLDFSRCRTVTLADGTQSSVKDHAKVGVQALIDHPYFALFDEMGAMKSAQVIIAAQFLFLQGVIDRVIVVAPASVRSGVWYDQELGELARHLWHDVPATISEFHTKIRKWLHGPQTATAEERLRWIITNYEFIRPIDYANKVVAKDEQRLAQLLPYCTPKTLLVLDESSAIKSAQTAQTKACLQLRKRCGRIVLLNGTPIDNSPGDMFSQGNMLSPSILRCASYSEFCARYAIMKPVLKRNGKAVTSKRGFVIKTIDSWTGIDDIQRRFAPYVLRRLKKDCLDLPEKLPPVMLNPALTPKLWKMYREMRDELVVWLTDATLSQAPQAMTKIMRLAQITSGFLGGIEDSDLAFTTDDAPLAPMPDYLAKLDHPYVDQRPIVQPVQEVGCEKQDLFLERLDAHLGEDPSIKILVRSRFRPEILRLAAVLRARGDVAVGTIIGGQPREERQAALRLLDPRTMPAGPVVVVMSVSAGALGLNLTGSHTMYTLSNDFSLRNRLQSDDRIHRPGQTSAVSYFEIVATGPHGQKTIDHRVLSRLMAKHDVATHTTRAWQDDWLDLLQDEA